MDMTFYPQKEIATKQLKLQSTCKIEDTDQDTQPQGQLSVLKKDDTEKIILGETINFQIVKPVDLEGQTDKAKDENADISQ